MSGSRERLPEDAKPPSNNTQRFWAAAAPNISDVRDQGSITNLFSKGGINEIDIAIDRRAKRAKRKNDKNITLEVDASTSALHATPSTHHQSHPDSCFDELLRVAEAHLSSQQAIDPTDAIDRRGKISNDWLYPSSQAHTSSSAKRSKVEIMDPCCSSSAYNACAMVDDCCAESCHSSFPHASLLVPRLAGHCPAASACCDEVHQSSDAVACQEIDCAPAIPCKDVRCLTEIDGQIRSSPLVEACTEACEINMGPCELDAKCADLIPADALTSNCPTCEETQPNYTTTFQEMLDCWYCSDHEFEQCCTFKEDQCLDLTDACDTCCQLLDSTAPIGLDRSRSSLQPLDSHSSRSRTTSMSKSSLDSPETSRGSFTSSSTQLSNHWAQDGFQKGSRDEADSLRCNFDEEHRHTRDGMCIPPGLTTIGNSCTAANKFLPIASTTYTCHWAGCGMLCNSIEQLTSHVNKTHLSLPIAPSMESSRGHEETTDSNQWADQSHMLKCMWDSCQMEQNTLDALTRSSWDDSNVILKHILQAHVGVEEASAALVSDRDNKRKRDWQVEDSASESRDGSNEKIDNSEHHCAWQDCTLCFDSHEALTDHITEDHVGSGKREYKCLWRGCTRGQRVFHQKQKMLRHLQVHTHHRPFVCDICQKRFSESNTLSQHRRTHTNERPYTCDFPGCGKSFAVAGSLTIHKRIHSGEKPFKCTWPGCNKAFAESSNLAKHHRIHSGAKPFVCTVDGCQLSFSRSDQLARHKKTHEKGVEKKIESR